MHKPQTHWLAIDKKATSYEELKYRRVVAQGWYAVGNLDTLAPLVGAQSAYGKASFIKVVNMLESWHYGDCKDGGTALYRFLAIQAGDVVVGIEGTTVRGFCQVRESGVESYRYAGPNTYNYAHTIGFPVTWVDWNEKLFGYTPRTPRLGVHGVTSLQNDRERVLTTWATWGREYCPGLMENEPLY